VRRLKLENEMLRSDERSRKEEAVYQDMARLQNLLDDVKGEKLSMERDNVRLMARLR